MNDPMFDWAVTVLLVTYGGIISEKMPRVYVAMAGALLMIISGLVTQDMAVKEYIDFNTLGLLVGMMMIIAVARQSGIFEAMAVWAVKVTHGRAKVLLALLALITAITSSIFDSVTAVLLLAPMTISLARRLGIRPYPFLIMEVLMSNIGGTALMVGNPPNVMIGSATHLTFNDFFINLAPVVLLTMVVIVPMLLFIYRKDLKNQPIAIKVIEKLDYRSEIKNVSLLKKTLLVLTVTIMGFIVHSALGLQSATVALTGAVILLIITRADAATAFSSVPWDTLFFFLGLFVVVGGLEAAGVIAYIAQWAFAMTSGDLVHTTFLVLWLSAFASAIIDNIPFTATMIPLIREMQNLMGVNVDFLWWALALGACFGGNGTLIGASPNLIIATIADRAGYNFTFWNYTKVCFPLMVVSVLICHAYLYFRYMMF